jgi:hypothetical protein
MTLGTCNELGLCHNHHVLRFSGRAAKGFKVGTQIPVGDCCCRDDGVGAAGWVAARACGMCMVCVRVCEEMWHLVTPAWELRNVDGGGGGGGGVVWWWCGVVWGTGEGRGAPSFAAVPRPTTPPPPCAVLGCVCVDVQGIMSLKAWRRRQEEIFDNVKPPFHPMAPVTPAVVPSWTELVGFVRDMKIEELDATILEDMDSVGDDGTASKCVGALPYPPPPPLTTPPPHHHPPPPTTPWPRAPGCFPPRVPCSARASVRALFAVHARTCACRSCCALLVVCFPDGLPPYPPPPTGPPPTHSAPPPPPPPPPPPRVTTTQGSRGTMPQTTTTTTAAMTTARRTARGPRLTARTTPRTRRRIWRRRSAPSLSCRRTTLSCTSSSGCWRVGDMGGWVGGWLAGWVGRARMLYRGWGCDVG